MRRLIVSDIHGNCEALQGVLRHCEGAYDEVVCCGDLVGYNAAPAEVIAWARETVRMVVRGNHDRACCDGEGLEFFNPQARAAAIWTQEELGEQDRLWLQELPEGPLFGDEYELAHGSPEDEDDYLLDSGDVSPLDQVLERKLCFVGHTHVQTGWSWQRGGLQRLSTPSKSEDERVIDLDPDYLYLINPGSVGQPRDGDARAAYVLWDDESRLVHFRRAKYNVRAAQERIYDAGLPSFLAERLALGR